MQYIYKNNISDYQTISLQPILFLFLKVCEYCCIGNRLLLSTKIGKKKKQMIAKKQCNVSLIDFT